MEINSYIPDLVVSTSLLLYYQRGNIKYLEWLMFHCEGPVPIGDSLAQYSFSVSISDSGTILDFIGMRC